MSERIQAARDYVARRPSDRFGLYTLAMELRKLRAWEESFSTWDTLLVHHPAYGAGFYHYAMTKKESGDTDGAVVVLRRGLQACETSGDSHTRAEIEEALEALTGGS